jgi:hypothetical protein
LELEEGVVGSEDAEGRLPTVSGDKIDKENISPCLDLSHLEQLKKLWIMSVCRKLEIIEARRYRYTKPQQSLLFHPVALGVLPLSCTDSGMQLTT